MANIQLAAMCVTLWAFLPCQARLCLSRCCNDTEIKVAGEHLTSKVKVPKPMPSQGCRTSLIGDVDVSQRSISPWSYVKDENSTRFPVLLWQARCNCPRCITLNYSLAEGNHIRHINWDGNSVAVTYNIIVYARTQCKEDPERYHLVPEPYTVKVACTCVAADVKR